MKRVLTLVLLAMILGCGSLVRNDGEALSLRTDDANLASQLKLLPDSYPIYPTYPQPGFPDLPVTKILTNADSVFEVSKPPKPEVQGSLVFEGECNGILTFYIDSLKLLGWKIENWTNGLNDLNTSEQSQDFSKDTGVEKFTDQVSEEMKKKLKELVKEKISQNNGILPGDDPDSTWTWGATTQIVATLGNRQLQLLLKKINQPLSVEVTYMGFLNE